MSAAEPKAEVTNTMPFDNEFAEANNGHMALRLTAKFITTAEAAERNGTTMRHVRNLCKLGKVPGATQFNGVWMVPSTFRWKPQKRGSKPKGRR